MNTPKMTIEQAISRAVVVATDKRLNAVLRKAAEVYAAANGHTVDWRSLRASMRRFRWTVFVEAVLVAEGARS